MFLISALVLLNPLVDKVGSLTYIAVLTEKNGQAHLVASTYGESKKLVVSIINAPKLASEQDLELWVISKSDGEARSFGVISNNQNATELQLTSVQWRLIKDSQALMVTIEEQGGSPADLFRANVRHRTEQRDSPDDEQRFGDGHPLGVAQPIGQHRYGEDRPTGSEQPENDADEQTSEDRDHRDPGSVQSAGGRTIVDTCLRA